MNWKRLLNPWAALREAETTMAILEDRCEEYARRCDDAERDAFHRASEHYYQRSRMVEAQLEYTQKQIAEISSHTPLMMQIPKDMLARMTGES